MNSLLALLTKGSVKVATLENIYASFHETPGFAAAAISAMRQLDSELAWRAVWLLRRLARDGKLDDASLVRIASCADELTHWISRLNLCQLLANTGCPPSVRDELFPYLADCFTDRRVIIRAWAISTLVQFQDDPKYRKRVAAMLREAQAESESSMIARLRQLSRAR